MNKDPKWHTSLYNHKPIAKDLPLIGNAEYRGVLEAVRNGDYEAYRSSLQHYCYEPKQKKIITDIIDKNIL